MSTICGFGNRVNVYVELQLAEVDWDGFQIGWLHAIFYVGLFISSLPCGYIVTKLPSHQYARAVIRYSLNISLVFRFVS